MGDRICLTFVDNSGERSPCLYSHWGGMTLIGEAEEFWKKYIQDRTPDDSVCARPIRTEPSNFMVNFVSHLTGGEIHDGGLYLYPTSKDSCSPDDNGYWVMNTDTGEIAQVEDAYYIG